MKKPCLTIVAISLLAGCTFAPSIDVLGAYFPDWLFCIVAGVSLTVLIHVVWGKTKLGQWITPVALTYPVLTTLFSLAVWLIFFEN